MMSYSVLQMSMGETVERVAITCGISPPKQDLFTIRSQQRAVASGEEFRREIVVIEIRDGLVNDDKHPRADTALEKLAKLKPAFVGREVRASWDSWFSGRGQRGKPLAEIGK